MTELLLPLALLLAIAFAALGGSALILWDRRVSRPKRRYAQVVQRPGAAVALPTVRSAIRSDRRAGPEGLEQALARLVPGRPAFEARLARAGIELSLTHYLLILAMLGGFLALSSRLMIGVPFLLALPLGCVEAMLLVNLVIGWMGNRRSELFLRQLPEAIDVMIRNIRSGLPLMEGIRIVAKEFPDPLRSEFASVSDRVLFGTPLDEALWSVARRIDRPEFNFLVISIAVQRETGGNLTEALQNLSGILRQREQMKLKVRAMSSEARASAYILGAMPFVMSILIQLTNPGYLDPLFVDPRGQVMLGLGLALIAVGALVMAKMVRFEI